MLRMAYRQSCRGKFRELEILTLPGIYIFECLIFMFKNKDKFCQYELHHDHQTRFSGYSVPQHRLTSTEKTTTYSCIKFFNKLPNELKCQTDFKLYKKGVFGLILNIEPYSVEEFLDQGPWCSFYMLFYMFFAILNCHSVCFSFSFLSHFNEMFCYFNLFIFSYCPIPFFKFVKGRDILLYTAFKHWRHFILLCDFFCMYNSLNKEIFIIIIYYLYQLWVSEIRGTKHSSIR